jgi:hypothetical protein
MAVLGLTRVGPTRYRHLAFSVFQSNMRCHNINTEKAKCLLVRAQAQFAGDNSQSDPPFVIMQDTEGSRLFTNNSVSRGPTSTYAG